MIPRLCLLALALCSLGEEALAKEPAEQVRDLRRLLDETSRAKLQMITREDRLRALGGLWGLDRDIFAGYLGSGSEQASALAADVLETMQDAPAWAQAQGLAHASVRVRAQSAAFLGRARVRQGAPGLADLLASDPADEVREMCARALSRIGTDAQVPALAKAAQGDGNRRVRRAATLAMAWLGTRAAGDALFEVIRGGDGPGVTDALRVLTGSASLQDGRAWWERNRPAMGYTVGEGIDYPKGGPRRCERRRVLYVFDVSGSIPRPDQQQRLYAAALERLPDGVWFDAIAFSLAPRHWKGVLVPADPGRRAAAARWIRNYDGKSGTTPLSAAIRKAFVEYDLDEVILCTDGGGNTGVAGKDIFNYVQAVNVCRRVRLKGVPVGNLDARAMGGGTTGMTLKRLVDESGGEYVSGGLASLR